METLGYSTPITVTPCLQKWEMFANSTARINFDLPPRGSGAETSVVLRNVRQSSCFIDVPDVEFYVQIYNFSFMSFNMKTSFYLRTFIGR